MIAEEKVQEASEKHIKFMAAIERLDSSEGGQEARTELIRELECGHQHLMEFAERNQLSLSRHPSEINYERNS